MIGKEPSVYCGTKYITKESLIDSSLETKQDKFFDVTKSDRNFHEQESEITLESLISAPVVAVSKANATMLSGQVQFILDYCFTKTKLNDKDLYQAIMIDLMIQKTFAEINENTSSIISIPLLSLLPINSLAIDKMKIDFSMEITSVSSKNDNSRNPQNKKAQLNGKLIGDNTNKGKDSASRGLAVNVEASKLPLPNGLLSIIEVYSKI